MTLAFVKIVHFSSDPPAAEFAEDFNAVFRLDESSLKTRIANRKKDGLATTQEEIALRALLKVGANTS